LVEGGNGPQPMGDPTTFICSVQFQRKTISSKSPLLMSGLCLDKKLGVLREFCRVFRGTGPLWLPMGAESLGNGLNGWPVLPLPGKPKQKNRGKNVSPPAPCFGARSESHWFWRFFPIGSSSVPVPVSRAWKNLALGELHKGTPPGKKLIPKFPISRKKTLGDFPRPGFPFFNRDSQKAGQFPVGPAGPKKVLSWG